MPPAIEVTNVGVAYRLPQIAPRSIKSFPFALLPRRRQHEALWALHEITFAVSPGEVVAVVGANGAGKSTLLRLLARAFKPSQGRVVVRGSIAPLIDLGGGLDPAVTARDNVVLYGALLGRRPSELRSQVEEILEWAGLLEFADVPIGVFSSGMLARLAFAIATAGSPDVLLIDEILGVGDAGFQQQSTSHLRELVHNGCSVVVVSHAHDELRALAARGILLERGHLVADAEIGKVLELHLQAAPAPVTIRRD